MNWASPFWFTVGLAALGAASAGVVLPLVPTTPFLLLAAFAFARSSPRLYRWLTEHPHFGPPIHAWRAHGAIRRRHKRLAAVLMGAAFAGSVLAGLSPVIIAVQAVVLAGAALFVLTRPDADERRDPM